MLVALLRHASLCVCFYRRGLVMGLWNSHTSVGNIAGSIVAGAFVERDWAMSFIVPGIIIILVSLPVLFFFVPRTSHNHRVLRLFVSNAGKYYICSNSCNFSFLPRDAMLARYMLETDRGIGREMDIHPTTAVCLPLCICQCTVIMARSSLSCATNIVKALNGSRSEMDLRVCS